MFRPCYAYLLVAFLMLLLPTIGMSGEIKLVDAGRLSVVFPNGIYDSSYRRTVWVADNTKLFDQNGKPMTKDHFGREFRGGRLRVIYDYKNGPEYRATEFHWLR